MSSPPTNSKPESGLSMPAMRLSSVDLPEPDGPMSPRKSPSGISSEMSIRTGTTWPRRGERLALVRLRRARQERDFRAHVRKHARILLLERDLHEQRRLRPVDRRHDARDLAEEPQLRIGIELDLRRHAHHDLADGAL